MSIGMYSPNELPRAYRQRERLIIVRNIPGLTPPSGPTYRMSEVELEEVKKQINELLNLGFIVPSKSHMRADTLCQRRTARTHVH